MFEKLKTEAGSLEHEAKPLADNYYQWWPKQVLERGPGPSRSIERRLESLPQPVRDSSVEESRAGRVKPDVHSGPWLTPVATVTLQHSRHLPEWNIQISEPVAQTRQSPDRARYGEGRYADAGPAHAL